MSESPNSDFVDYYELLEVSPKANLDTIERVFRYLAKRHHPDTAGNLEAEKKRFNLLIEAFDTLRNPESRAQYDLDLEAHRQAENEVLESANAAENDCLERMKILQLFYGQRRRDFRQPGVSIGRIEDLLGCDPDVLQFHLWYFREKNWLAREESGLLSITAIGVDHIESHYSGKVQEEFLRITDESHKEEAVATVPKHRSQMHTRAANAPEASTTA